MEILELENTVSEINLLAIFISVNGRRQMTEESVNLKLDD